MGSRVKLRTWYSQMDLWHMPKTQKAKTETSSRIFIIQGFQWCGNSWFERNPQNIHLAPNWSCNKIQCCRSGKEKRKKEDIAEAIIKNWIASFGAPRGILSDNWGEFNNELLREVCEQFNITIKSTAAEAPWSNGIVERHNTVLGKMIKKLKLDNNNTYSIVPWAIKAKNGLQSCYALAQTNLYLEKVLICHQI